MNFFSQKNRAVFTQHFKLKTIWDAVHLPRGRGEAYEQGEFIGFVTYERPNGGFIRSRIGNFTRKILRTVSEQFRNGAYPEFYRLSWDYRTVGSIEKKGRAKNPALDLTYMSLLLLFRTLWALRHLRAFRVFGIFRTFGAFGRLWWFLGNNSDTICSGKIFLGSLSSQSCSGAILIQV